MVAGEDAMVIIAELNEVADIVFELEKEDVSPTPNR